MGKIPDPSPRSLEDELPAGMSEDAFREAVVQSGYPLQTRVASRLQSGGFSVSEEWAFTDSDEGKRRAIDVLGRASLMHVSSDEARREQHTSLAVIVECKQARYPLVFFKSVAPPALHDHFPLVAGVGAASATVSLSPVESPDVGWIRTASLTSFLDTAAEPLATVPPLVSSVSRAMPQGSNVTMSGEEVYRSLTMPLIKAAASYQDHHYPDGRRGEGESVNGVRFVLPIAVVDGPMVLVEAPSAEPSMRPVSWVRMLVQEPVQTPDGTSLRRRRPRIHTIDVVHWRFFETFLRDFAMTFLDAIGRRIADNSKTIADGALVPNLAPQGSPLPRPLYEAAEPR